MTTNDTLPQSAEARGVQLDENSPAENIDTFPIFAIGGKQYYAPTRPSARIELEFLHRAQRDGQFMAAAWLMEALLGSAAYEALMNYEGLTHEHVERIFGRLRESIEGAAIGPGPKDSLRIA